MAYQAPKNGFRTFLIVLGTQSVSALGTALTLFATNIWLLQSLYPNPEQRPQLTAALTVINLAFGLPALIVAPIAGAWADRHDRKRIMMVTDFGAGIISVVLAMIMVSGRLNLFELAALMALASTLGQFHNSAFDTSYAMIVPEEKLPRANGMMQTMWALVGVISPGIAAAVIAVPGLIRARAGGSFLAGLVAGLPDGAPVAIIIDALTFFFAAAALIFVNIPSPRRADLEVAPGAAKPTLMEDVRAGLLYILHRSPLLWLLGTFALCNFLSAPLGVLYPLIIKFQLAADWTARGFNLEAALALFGTLISVGGLAGGLIISAWGGLKKNRVYGVLVPMVLAGLTQAIFGFSSRFYFSSAAIAICIGLYPLMNAHSQTIWQAQTPRELQGRVFAVRRVIAQGTGPVSIAFSGWLAASFDPGAVTLIFGLAMAAMAFVQLFNPVLRRIEDREWLEGLARAAASRPAQGGGVGPAAAPAVQIGETVDQ